MRLIRKTTFSTLLRKNEILIPAGIGMFAPVLFLLMIPPPLSIEATVSWNDLSANSPHLACQQDTLTGSVDIGSATNVTIEVAMATGVSYVPNSAAFSGAASLLSEDASDLSNPVFSLSNPSGTVTFTLIRQANCGSYSHQVGGGLLIDTARVFESGVQIGGDYQSNQYALSYGILSISPVSSTPSSALTGESVTRSMTITNGNYGAIDTFWFAEIFDPGDMAPDSFTIDPGSTDYLIPSGQIIEAAGGDSVYLMFGPDEIRQIGDGDSLFENGESFTLSYQVELTGCGNGTTISSTPTTWWGCGGSSCQYYQQSAGISLIQAEPDLSYSISVNSSGCLGYGADPDTIVIEIVNSGAGPATEIEFGFQSQHPTVGGFDTSSITYELEDGSTGSITATSLTNPVTDEFQCATDWPGPGSLYSNGKIAPGVTLPDSSTMWIRVLSYRCCPSVCMDPEDLPGNNTYFGTSYQIDSYFRFNNQCGQNQQDLGPGTLTSNTMSLAYSLFTPPNLFDGASSTYTYLDFTELQFSGLLDDLSDAKFRLEAEFPTCVDLGGDSSTIEWVDQDGVSTFDFDNVTVTDSGFTVEWMLSDLGASLSLNLSGTQIRFPIQADCAEGSCDFSGVDLSFSLLPDVSCSSGCELQWICENITVDILCPGTCPEGGGQLLSSIFERENLGEPDGDNNGCPDDDNDCDGTGEVSPTSFNASLVRRERALSGDTILSSVNGIIKSGSASSTWEYLFFENQLSDASVMDVIEMSFRFVDASTGMTAYSTSGLSTVTVGDTVRLDLSIEEVRSDLGLPGSVTAYEDGDSVEVIIRYRLNENLTSTTENISTQNLLYTSLIASPDSSGRYSCASTRGVLIAGKPGTSTYKSWVTFPTGCTSKNIGFNTEVFLDGAAIGNNFFPYEYRIWAKPQKYIVTVPQGYVFDRVRLNHKRTAGNGTSSANFYTDSLQMTDSTWHPDGAVTYTYDIMDAENADIWAENGGNYFYSDDGAFFMFVAEVHPGCESPSSWRSDDEGGSDYLQKHEYLDVLEEVQYRTGSSNLFFSKPSLTTSCVVPEKEAITTELEWEINLRNLSSTIPVDYAWIALVSPTGYVGDGTLELYNDEDSLLSVSANGLYELGTMATNAYEEFTVVADYSTCDADSLYVLVGWDCDEYPESLAEYACTIDTVTLSITPASGQISVEVTDLASTPSDPSDGASVVFGEDSISLCEEFPVEFTLNSALPSALDNVFAIMDVPVSSSGGGLDYVAGSGYYEYPIGSTPQAFPAGVESSLLAQNGSAQFLFDWSEIGAADIGADYELPGVYEAAASRSVILRMTFRPTCDLPVGDNFNIRAFATYGCGAAAEGYGENLAGEDLHAKGVTPDYQMTINVGSIDTFTNAELEHQITISLAKSGSNPVESDDSLVLRLPAGLTYAGWGSCISGTCPDSSQVSSFSSGGQEFYTWPMPSLANGESCEFTIDLELNQNLYGTLGQVEVQARHYQFLECSTEGSGYCPNPGVVLSGSGSRAVSAYLPEVLVDISDLEAYQYVDSVYTFHSNISIITGADSFSNGLWVELYCANPNTGFSTNDPPMDSLYFEGPISSGSIIEQAYIYRGVCDPSSFGIMALIPDTMYSERVTQLFSPAFRGRSIGGTLEGTNPYDIATTAQIVFPLDWLSVSLIPQGNTALLHWEVAQDVLPVRYEVERAEAGLPFRVMEEILPTDTQVGSYTWEDRWIRPGKPIIYRIRAIHQDGSMETSPSVELAPLQADAYLRILNNPAADLVHIAYHIPESTGRVSLMSLQGQLLWEQTIDDREEETAIDISEFPAGIYLIRIISGASVLSDKFEIR